MKNALQMSHDFLDQIINQFPTGVFIDATLGRGSDSAFILSHPAFKGQVFAFDIQPLALDWSRDKLKPFDPASYQLFLASHDEFDAYLPINHYPSVHGAIFNLGYLPGASHDLTTHARSTLSALKQIANRLVNKGQIILVVYSGHPQGKNEKNALLDQLATWSQDHFTILKLAFVNQKNDPPLLIVIEKK